MSGAGRVSWREAGRVPRPFAAKTKGGSVPQQPATRGIRAAEALGLTIFLATAALLTGLLITLVVGGLGNLQEVSSAFSTACAVIAAFAMLMDAADLWVRGRRFTPHSVRLLRSLVFVAIMGAVAASLLGENVLVIMFLFPSMIIYLFIARKRPAGSGPPQSASRAGSGGTVATSSSARSRQRRGGMKRR
jgi:hypothetical protein